MEKMKAKRRENDEKADEKQTKMMIIIPRFHDR